MDVDVDGAGEGAVGGGEMVRGAPAAVPEVLGRVSVGDKEEGEGSGGGGADGGGGGGVVFG